MKHFLILLLLLTTVSGCVFNLDFNQPVITLVSTSVVKYSSATITWSTNEDTTSQVEYGKTAEYGSTTPLNETLTKNHAVELTHLDPVTTYYYRVKSRDGSGNVTTSEGESFHTTVEGVFSIEYEWEFKDKSWKYSAEIDESDYDYFANKTRVADYAEYVSNDADDEWMKSLAGLFVDKAKEEGWGKSYYVPFALSFVQSLPYTNDGVTTGYNEYPRYPMETIVDGGGDCEDTCILFASIVREMGFGVALLLLKEDEHMAAGIQIDQSFLNSWDKDYDCTYYTDTSTGTMYAYCETTSKGWEIGEKPDEVTSTTAEIIPVF